MKSPKVQVSFKPIVNAIAALFGTTMIAGCMSISTMSKLSRLDPLQTDPQQIRLAVSGPKEMRFRDGDVKLVMSFDGGTPQTQLSEAFVADIDRNAQDVDGITKQEMESATFVVLQLTQTDATRMRVLQDQIKELRASGNEGRGSLGIIATGCLTTPKQPATLPVTAWIETMPGDGFILLMRDADMAEAVKASGEALDRCELE